MTPDDLARIEARAAATTPGPWAVLDGHVIADWEDIGVVEPVTEPFIDPRDAEFIAHAREDVPALIAALRVAWAERDRLRTVERDALVVLSVAFPTNTMPWLMDVGVAACVSLLASERDAALAALARVEALCDYGDIWDATDFDAGRMHALDAVRAAMKGES